MELNSSLGNLMPLKVTCTSADCGNNLHCFLETKEMAQSGRRGECRYCGEQLVDWERIRKQDLNDVDYTFSALEFELIRHYFWHKEIDLLARNHARRKGRNKLREAAERRIIQSVFPAIPTRDGRQTPFSGNILYYAQHATATCCRRCIEEWHDIPKGRSLTSQEITYFTELLMKYVNQQLPELTDEGEKVPAVRKK